MMSILPALTSVRSFLQGRAVQRRPGKCAVVIMVGDQAPALVRLALYVGLAGLALGVEGIELEIEVMLGRFSGVRVQFRLAAVLFDKRRCGVARTEIGYRR